MNNIKLAKELVKIAKKMLLSGTTRRIYETNYSSYIEVGCFGADHDSYVNAAKWVSDEGKRLEAVQKEAKKFGFSSTTDKPFVRGYGTEIEIMLHFNIGRGQENVARTYVEVLKQAGFKEGNF